MKILAHKNQVVIDQETTSINARKYREEKKVGMRPLARAMDVSVCYISLLERGKSAWSAPRAAAFEAAVNRLAGKASK